MAGAVITGIVATIRWSYYEAAAINGYTITRDELTRAWSVSGNIVMADLFKLSQRPLLLVVPFNKGKWTWPIRGTVPRCTGPFRVDLDPPLERIRNAHPNFPAGTRPY